MDYTKSAVERQLSAMNCDTYEIGIYHPEKGMINRNYTKEEVLNSVNYLKFLNTNGNNIYIRPAEDDVTPLVLIDDLNWESIEKLENIGINLALIIETSRENFQVWIKLHKPVLPEIKSQIAKNVTKFAHGDPASAEKRHYGRLAGFTNRKEKHKDEAGKFPFCLCRQSSGDVTSKSRELIERAERDIIDVGINNRKNMMIEKEENRINIENIVDLFTKYMKEWESKQTGTLDRSKGDFAVAARLIQEGHSPDAIQAAMMQASPAIETRKRKNVAAYAARTVEAAKAAKKKPVSRQRMR